MGIFVSVEGTDGCGKTTQMDLLEKRLQKEGVRFLRSREPGGTAIGEKIRNLVLDPENQEMNERAEALLYAASRAQHVEEKIKPALKDYDLVLCDRFLDSSIVYQGIGRGLGAEEIKNINLWAVGNLLPDLTIVLYLDYEEGLKRKSSQKHGELDRLEQANEAFFRRVNEGFLELKNMFPDRVVIVDASRSIDEIHEDITSRILKALKEA